MAKASKNSAMNISALVTYWQASEQSARPPKNRNELLENARKFEPAFKCSTYDLLNAIKEIKESIRQNALIGLPYSDVQENGSIPLNSMQSAAPNHLYNSFKELCNCFELQAIEQAKEQARILISNELSKITLALDAIKIQNADLQEKLAKAIILLNQSGAKFDAKDFEITSIEGAIDDIKAAFLNTNTASQNNAISLKSIDLSQLFTSSFDDFLNSNTIAISLNSLSDNVNALNTLIADMATNKATVQQTTSNKKLELDKGKHLDSEVNGLISTNAGDNKAALIVHSMNGAGAISSNDSNLSNIEPTKELPAKDLPSSNIKLEKSAKAQTKLDSAVNKLTTENELSKAPASKKAKEPNTSKERAKSSKAKSEVHSNSSKPKATKRKLTDLNSLVIED